jgi:AraC-like DNA-binding protein/mannose-6-phosphate isomerase-like protein (cupin superfamily)
MREEEVQVWNKQTVSNDSVRLICTTSATAKNTFFYVQEVGYMKLLKSAQTNRENLDSLLFVVVVKGKGTLTYKEHQFNVSSGCCFFIDCLNTHSYEGDPSDPWELLWIHFNGPTARGYYNYFEETFVNVIKPNNIYPFEEILRRILEINRNNDAYTEVRTNQLITELLTLTLTFKKNDLDYTIKAAKSLSEVKDYLDKNFTEEIYLETLCDQFCMSKFYLTKEFKKAYGVTISKYIIACRINHAKRLLRFTDKPIDEISEECGFYDTSYFNKQFKASEDITPFKYRKTWHER